MFIFRNWQGVYLGPSRLWSTREEVGVWGMLETRKAGFAPALLETMGEHAFVSALLNWSNWGRSCGASLFLVFQRSVYWGPTVCAYSRHYSRFHVGIWKQLASSCLWFNVVEKAVVQLTPLQGRLFVTPLEGFQGLWVHFQSEKWHQGAGVGSGFEEDMSLSHDHTWASICRKGERSGGHTGLNSHGIGRWRKCLGDPWSNGCLWAECEIVSGKWGGTWRGGGAFILS